METVSSTTAEVDNGLAVQASEPQPASPSINAEDSVSLDSSPLPQNPMSPTTLAINVSFAAENELIEASPTTAAPLSPKPKNAEDGNVFVEESSSNVEVAKKRDRKGTTFGMIASKLKNNIATAVQRSVTPQQQTQQNAASGNTMSSPRLRSATRMLSTWKKKTILVTNGENPVKKLEEQAPKIVVDPEDAPKIIARKVANWWFWKKFRKYTSHPDLKQQRLRVQLLKEILTTEQGYVSGLRLCLQEFYFPLKKKAILTEEELNTIFSNIEQITQANEILLKETETEHKKWPLFNIGAVFFKYVPFLKIYITYFNNYENSNQAIDSLFKKNKRFLEFLEKKYEQTSQTLSALLITPIQRIPRYRLLFKELLQLTPSKHNDHKIIQQANSLIESLAAEVNEKKRSEEHTGLFIDLTRKIKSINLLQPHRVFIRKSMEIRISCPRKNLNHRCEVYLFNDSLLIIPIDESDISSSKLASRYEMIFFAFCALAKISSHEEQDKERIETKIEAYSKGVTVVYTLKFPTGIERKEWESNIEYQITYAERASATKGLDASENVEEKRTRLFNKIHLAETKLEKYKEDFLISKAKLVQIEKVIREARQEYEKLKIFLEQEAENEQQAQQEVSDMTEKCSEVEKEIESDTAQLLLFDTTLLHALNEDEDAFKEIFGRESIITEKEKLRSGTIKPTNKTALDFILRQNDLAGASERILLPQNGTVNSMPGLPQAKKSSLLIAAANALKANELDSSAFDELSQKKPKQQARRKSRGPQDSPVSSSVPPRTLTPPKAPPSVKQRSRRVMVRRESVIYKNNPYVLYFMQKTKEQLDRDKKLMEASDVANDNEVTEYNKLFRVRPLPTWFYVEQNLNVHKYKFDRMTYGEHSRHKPPSIPMFDSESSTPEDIETYQSNLYMNDIEQIEYSALPNDIDQLKTIIMSLSKELKMRERSSSKQYVSEEKPQPKQQQQTQQQTEGEEEQVPGISVGKEESSDV